MTETCITESAGPLPDEKWMYSYPLVPFLDPKLHDSSLRADSALAEVEEENT